MNIHQPNTIEHGGHSYTLMYMHREVEHPISEGPFYSRPGVDPCDWLFVPDLSFLMWETETPMAMFCIQASISPKTEKPK